MTWHQVCWTPPKFASTARESSTANTWTNFVSLISATRSCSCSLSVLPWHCRWCVGSCCLYDRELSTDGHSLDEVAHRAAGSRLLLCTRRGGRSFCSGGFHMAKFYYMSGRRKCPADDMGCCCVAVGKKKSNAAWITEKKNCKSVFY